MTIQLTPETAPTRIENAATVVLLRDCEPNQSGLEVFLMRRATEASVHGGAHVFPGGKVDPADWLLAPQALDRPATELHAALSEPELTPAHAVAIHVAAVRELFEESGVLLSVAPPPWPTADVSAARDVPNLQVEAARTLPFNTMAQRLRVQLAVSALAPWSRWITPEIPGLVRRRFDTRFFVAQVPADQQPAVADRESTEGRWLTPRAALALYWDRAIDLAPPQIITLAHLARFACAQDALTAARSTLPRLVQPMHREIDALRFICYPGDVHHAEPEPAFPGVSRLVQRNGRFEPEAGFESLFG